ncbi:hypothetical protein BH23ACT6_BH23ACT6_09330 [soil metagenome]
MEKRPQMLDFCEPKIIESLKFHPRDLGLSFRTELQLTEESVPFEVGISRYRELARGQMWATPTHCSN